MRFASIPVAVACLTLVGCSMRVRQAAEPAVSGQEGGGFQTFGGAEWSGDSADGSALVQFYFPPAVKGKLLDGPYEAWFFVRPGMTPREAAVEMARAWNEQSDQPCAAKVVRGSTVILLGQSCPSSLRISLEITPLPLGDRTVPVLNETEHVTIRRLTLRHNRAVN